MNEELPNDQMQDPEPNEVQDGGSQTRFAEESALFSAEQSLPRTAVIPAQPKSKKTLLIIGLIIMVVVVLLLAVVLSSMRSQINLPRNLTNVIASPTSQINDELTKRLYEADQEITKADPSQTELSFPPVSFELDLKDASLLKKKF